MIHHSLTPRPITEREKRIILLYADCELAMTPQQFYAKWNVPQEALLSFAVDRFLLCVAGLPEEASTAILNPTTCVTSP